MSNTILYNIILLFLFGTGCQSGKENGVTENDSLDTAIKMKESTNLDGYWILTDYYDSIFKDRTIANIDFVLSLGAP
jgi:hypothetical protein